MRASFWRNIENWSSFVSKITRWKRHQILTSYTDVIAFPFQFYYRLNSFLHSRNAVAILCNAFRKWVKPCTSSQQSKQLLLFSLQRIFIGDMVGCTFKIYCNSNFKANTKIWTHTYAVTQWFPECLVKHESVAHGHLDECAPHKQ